MLPAAADPSETSFPESTASMNEWPADRGSWCTNFAFRFLYIRFRRTSRRAGAASAPSSFLAPSPALDRRRRRRGLQLLEISIGGGKNLHLAQIEFAPSTVFGPHQISIALASQLDGGRYKLVLCPFF